MSSPGDGVVQTSLYQRALSVLAEALAFGIEPSLVGVTALANRLGRPQDHYISLQIAGTNGKSSTARFTAAFLRARGYKVGLYTSPELIEYPERMEINGSVVSRDLFSEAILAADRAAQAAIAAGECACVTEFELLTAAALWLFAEQGVDYAVLEVGLGGRWDATSVVDATVAVITGIDLDHTAILGDTVEQIAGEKAAIIKSGSRTVLGEGTTAVREVFLARCRQVGAVAPVIAEGDGIPASLDTRRFPGYQRMNIACALAATELALAGRTEIHATGTLLEGPDLIPIQSALDRLQLPGRFELIREEPALLIDAAHNPESAETLSAALRECYGIDTRTGRIAGFDTLLLGVLGDKDAEGIISALSALFDNLVVTQSASPRAIPVADLARIVTRLDCEHRKPQVYLTVADALKALTGLKASVVATGSITLAGEVKACLPSL